MEILSSRIKGFYTKTRTERLAVLQSFSNIEHSSFTSLDSGQAIDFDLYDSFIENAIGTFPLPMGIATNFKVNNEDYLVPMAVEESSVIAAASNAAKWIYKTGGFSVDTPEQIMIGQIQVTNIEKGELESTKELILANKEKLIDSVNKIHPRLVQRGGGAIDLDVRIIDQPSRPFLVVHLHINTCEAMGANLINTACESLAPQIEIISGGRVLLRILSNLASERVFKARCKVLPEDLEPKDANLKSSMSGSEIAKRIVEAYEFADHDPYRAATHNKGIMNGVDPVVIATGNDWRAIEAGAHSYAAQSGRYRSLTTWNYDGDYLHGTLEIPLQLGTVGGVTRLHPTAQTALAIMKKPNVKTLGAIIASAGLASNLAALRALTTAGIQKGHMKLHAKNIALSVGAKGDEIEIVAKQLFIKKQVNIDTAKEVLNMIRSGSNVSI